MNLSPCRVLKCIGVLLATIGSVSCTQSGIPDASARLSPTAPSSLDLVSPTAGRPTSNYDATGDWHWMAFLNGELIDEVDAFPLVQDANGNITSEGEGEGELFTFTRVAITPQGIRYNVTLVGEGDPCDADLRGTAVLDTETDTITGTLTGRSPSDDQTSCLTIARATFVLTRNN